MLWVRTPGAWLILLPPPHPYIFFSLLPLGPLSETPGMLHLNPRGSLTPWIFLASDPPCTCTCACAHTQTHTETVLLVHTQLKCIPRDICVHKYIDTDFISFLCLFQIHTGATTFKPRPPTMLAWVSIARFTDRPFCVVGAAQVKMRTQRGWEG